MDWHGTEEIKELKAEIARLREGLESRIRCCTSLQMTNDTLRALLVAARPYVEYCAEDNSEIAINLLREIDALGVLRTNRDGAIDGGASLLPRSGA